MSERGDWKSGTSYSAVFWVKDSSGIGVTGLVDGDFTKYLSVNGVNSVVTVTVTEVDSANLPGFYKATYTPNATGYWDLLVTNATYNLAGWEDTIQAYSNNLDSIPGSVWEELLASHTTAGSFGELFSKTVLRRNTMQAGSTSTTAVLDASASSTNDWYNNCILRVIAGTGAGQSRLVQSYVGSTKTATMGSAWITTPDDTSVFQVMAGDESAPFNVANLVDGYSPALAMAYIGACCVALSSGEPSSPAIFKGLNGSATRVTVTYDANNNRTAVTLS